MTLYYFHLHSGRDFDRDEEGRQMAGPGGIPAAALVEARSVISEDAKAGCIHLDQRIDVEDEHRNLVHSLHFADAVSITGRDA